MIEKQKQVHIIQPTIGDKAKEIIKKYPEIKEAYLLKYYINEEKYQYFLGVIFDKKEKNKIQG